MKPLPALLAVLAGSAGVAQAQETPRSDAPSTKPDANLPEVVVTGQRGSAAVGNIAPTLELDAETLAAMGATDMSELVRIVRQMAGATSGAEPLFLLNAERVSGYQEIGALPPEAIEKVEVLPPQAALRYGYPPDRQVLNFITKRRFRQFEVKGSGGMSTSGGGEQGTAGLNFTRLRNDSRITATLEYSHDEPILFSDRDVSPNPDILYDAIGNIAGAAGGEIDPALSALAGYTVTVAPVPQDPADRSSLSGFAAGANRPRLFDPGALATLVPRKDTIKSEIVLSDRIGETTYGSISLSGERNWEASLNGPPIATLMIPSSNPSSVFSGPVLLYRALTEAAPLRRHYTTTKLHGGGSLRGTTMGWQWDLTAAVDQEKKNGRIERNMDMSAVNAAIAGGLDPYAPLDASLLSGRPIDHLDQTTRTASVKAVASNHPLRLPSGDVTLTASAEYERSSANSITRGGNPSDFDLARSRSEGSLAIDVPIASRRDDFLPFLGQLSVNASIAERHVGGFGGLRDTTYGLNWAIGPAQLLVTDKHTQTAPEMAQLAAPQLYSDNVPVFDYSTGRTTLVTLFSAGNPDLAAERRHTRSFELNLKPFAKRQLRLSATYEIETSYNKVATVYANTPAVEAILPDLFVRDAEGALTSVTYMPINLYRSSKHQLQLKVNISGPFLKRKLAGSGGESAAQRGTYYAGMGTTLGLRDRVLIRQGTPELDVLGGDTITGWFNPPIVTYVYSGFNRSGYGMTFNAVYLQGNHIRSATPSADLTASSVVKFDISGNIPLSHLFQNAKWADKLMLKLEVTNITNATQKVRDAEGEVPNRLQPAYLDPRGRTIKVTLRKRF